MDTSIARSTWQTVEPLHSAIYFVPEAAEEYAALGFERRMSGYFASRAAPMGPVATEVVTSTFFNFDPGYVAKCMEGAWDTASPSDLVAARLRGADRMLRRIVPDAINHLAEAAEIAREAALVACEHAEGRPLFAGHTALEWPDEPHLVLWHAQTLLREFRGDGHIAALTTQGLSGCESLVSHAAAGDVPAEVLKSSRKRSDEDWRAAQESLQSRGWLDADGSFTDFGRSERQWIEDRTDHLSLAPYAAIGDDACERLRSICGPVGAAMAAAMGR